MTKEEVLSTDGEVEDTSTPAEGVTAEKEVTPDTKLKDADSTSELEAIRQKYETDISRMKSTFQRKEAEREKEFNRIQSQLDQEMERLRLASMDDDEREAYEQTSQYRKMQEMAERLEELESQNLEIESIAKAQAYFLANGVPASELVFDEGYEALWNSGMSYIMQEAKELREKLSKAPKSAPEKPPVNAPEVTTSTSTPAYTGTTWDELIKRYGSEEEVYRLIETQQLDPSILPVPKGA